MPDLTVTEAAAKLGISRQALHGLIRRKVIPARRASSGFLLSEADVAAHLPSTRRPKEPYRRDPKE